METSESAGMSFSRPDSRADVAQVEAPRKTRWGWLGRGLLYLFAIGGSLIMAFPLLWMLATSLKTQDEANASHLVWFPAQPRLDAYLTILSDQTFVRAYLNSAFVTILGVAGTLISVAAVAYAFSRVEWPGRNIVFVMMLSTLMIPAQALIVPQYVFFNAVHWIGTFNPIIIPGFFAGGAAMIFLLRQFMAQLPHELDEAAYIDGASHFQVWWHIIMPLSAPALATIATFLFVANWNSLLAPVIYLQDSALYTLPVYDATLVNPQQSVQPWPTIMAASVLTVLPLIILFIWAQRYLLESIALTGSKG